ncbi:hypothetical protein [Hyphomonas atlantica corrig.]|uniref:hypothetical protein n=1 Tax=Hyphomonas atlantica TaxID=1280948 RepID=UPI00235485EA|nr:hypothetical protein [Hyphomonas atlantica]
MKTYLQPKDDAEVDVPLRLDLVENNPVWPAVPGGNAVIFMGGDSFGLVAGAD